ncbi:MAG TPA: PilZ domain-containing protein, partial [Thermoanaerobaculia bacterium]|nr:PilZ domain-containing protein [Thermoanaerobaculia bacterium]
MISDELARQPAMLSDGPDGPDVREETERTVEERRSPRRRTLAAVRVLEGPDLEGGDGLVVTDLSADGAFIRGARGMLPEMRLRLAIEIPTDPRPLLLAARVVRETTEGVGVRFEEASARDRASLRSHAGFYEMDEAIVRVQRMLGDLIPGNLLPLGEPSEIQMILQGAVERALPVTVIRPGRGFRPLASRLAALTPGNGHGGPGAHGAMLHLEAALPAGSRVLYLTFSDGPLHYAFEGIVLDSRERGERPALLVPERVYLTERRAERRSSLLQAWCELPAPYAP